MRLLLALSLAGPALAARFTLLQLSGEQWCVQTKDGSTAPGAALEYGKCGFGPTQRWSYVENQLRLFGTDDRCLGIKDRNGEARRAVLASCIPTDDPTVETSWSWNTTVRAPICTYREEGAPPIQESWCLSAIGGQEPEAPELFLSWVQRSVPFEPVRTRKGALLTEAEKCAAAASESNDKE